MCKADDKLHLCSCSDMKSLSDSPGISAQITQLSKSELYCLIRWRLLRFIKSEWSGLDGLLIRPVNELTSRITADFLQNLMNNTQNCFDFEYTPSVGDQIIFDTIMLNKYGKITIPESQYKFVSLIYKRRKGWGIDNYNSFYDITEQFKQGFVKISE